MSQSKQCPSCRSFESSLAVFCSQCRVRLGFPDMSYKVLVDDTEESARDFLPLMLISVPLVALVIVISIFLSGCGNPPPKTIVASGSAIPKTTSQEVSAYTDASFDEQTITGKVVAVADGDTITVLDSNKKQWKIRLEGIDAPEAKQDFGEKSRQNLAALVFGKTVQVITGKTDKYGRTLGKVIFDGRDINLEQIKAGLAWHYKVYEKEQSADDRKLYADAELQARDINAGLWAQAKFIAPWDFRSGKNLANVDETKIYGNSGSKIYHWAGCPGFVKIGEKNRVVFNTAAEAESAGYRAAKNCSTAIPRSSESNANRSNESLEASVSDQSLAPSYVVPTNNRTVERTTPATAPSGASARCADGTYSYSQSRRGTCSRHGGVAEWLSSSSTTEYTPAPVYSAPRSNSSRYIRGPRGGCYYINGNGNKSYVDRSLCN